MIPKAVGGAVVRNRLRRRLRALLAPRLRRLPAATTLVVRALPGAGELDSAALAAALDAALPTPAASPEPGRTTAVTPS